MRAAFANFALLKRRDFSLLWFAGLISTIGDFALITALPLYAYEVTGSAVVSGGVFAAGIVPSVLFGSIAGVFVDRWDRKRIMVAADLLRAVLLLPLLLVASADGLWLIFVVRAAISGCSIFFTPAENALLPHLVGEEHLVAANALNTLNNNLGRLVGPAAGGVLFAWSGLLGIVWIDAVSFLGSAGLIALIGASGRVQDVKPVAVDGAGVFQRTIGEWIAGLQLVRQGWALRIVFLAYGVGMLAEGTFEAGFAALTLDVLKGGPQGAGLLFSAQAIGGFVGGLVVTARAARLTPWKLFGGGLVGLGIADFGFAGAGLFAEPGITAIAIAAGFITFAGVPVIALGAGLNSLIQSLVPDAFRGRVFGALGTVSGLSTLLGIAIGGPAIDAIGVVPIFMAGATMWIAGGLIALVCFARRPPAPIEQPAPAAVTE